MIQDRLNSSFFNNIHVVSGCSVFATGTGFGSQRFLSSVGKKCSQCSRPDYHHYLHCKHFIPHWTIDQDNSIKSSTEVMQPNPIRHFSANVSSTGV